MKNITYHAHIGEPNLIIFNVAFLFPHHVGNFITTFYVRCRHYKKYRLKVMDKLSNIQWSITIPMKISILASIF